MSSRLWGALLGLFLLLGTGCSQELQGGLAERHANEALVVLHAEGIAATKKRAAGNSFTLMVPRTQSERALAVLVTYGLPRRETNYMSLLGESAGLVPSAQTERARRAAMISASLEETLLALSDVYDAFVHVVLPPESSALASRQEPGQPRLSVVLVTPPEGGPPDEAVRAIAMGAVDGLPDANIAVVRSSVRLPSLSPVEMVTVGPFAVASESAGLLRLVLGLAGVVLLVVSLLLVVVLVRGREQ